MSEIELLDKLLQNRGIEGDKNTEKFLNPDYKRDLMDPFLLSDMERAIVRIFEAIEGNEKIIVYSDYDCDGIPAAVIISDLLKKIRYLNFEIYIPDRHEEGFGLHQEAIHKFRDAGVNLIITFDLGVTDIEEIVLAQSFGIDVIVTDHHLPIFKTNTEGQVLEILPKAYAVINPKRKDDRYPDKNLCGSGVAFKVVQAFVKKYGEYFKIHDGWEKWLLDMAGIATLSDMVPLLGENRAIAYFGLKVLQKNKRPGLRKMFADLKIDARHIVEEDITFMLTPRLNAASRMDDPKKAFDLLSTNSEEEAGVLSKHLVQINDDRKILVANIMKEVNKLLEKREEKSLIVIGNPSWRAGVLGLIASKIVDQYKKPCFVWGSDFKGSCRSYEEVNLVEIMSRVKENIFVDFGGHKLAGGFSVSNESVFFLEEELLNSYANIIKEQSITEKRLDLGDLKRSNLEEFDAVLLLSEVSPKNYKIIEKLAPFGLGNPKPVFLFENVEIKKMRQFGKNKDHLELYVSDGSVDNPLKAIQFFKDENSYVKQLKEGSILNLKAHIEKSLFLGRTEIRLRIVDLC